jgi:exosortase A
MSEPAAAMNNPATAATASNWRAAMGLALAAAAALLGMYHGTFASMLDIWWRSETYAHGFLIFPISAWLIWRRRKALSAIAPRPDYRALPALAAMGLGWLVARLSEVLVVEQLALIGMIPALVWLLLGGRVFRELGFPLGFLVFSVPMGEFLIPPLMDFTADFTVGMLRLTGIPVFREGTFFSIPSGDWSVIEACSGLRYLIASITLGFLYAYLSYVSFTRRWVFITLAVVVPVIANGLRAYMIVMIGHLSGMKLAVGVDHLIYGWVFFGGVMLLLFWVGSLWAEEERVGDRLAELSAASGAVSADGWRLGLGFAVAMAVAAVWPVRAAYVERQAEARGNPPVVLTLPEGAGGWSAAAAATEWAPNYIGPDATAKGAYQDGSATVSVYLMYYRRQRQGAELINSQNTLAPSTRSIWRMPEESPVEIRLDGGPAKVLQGRALSPRQQLLTWRWNWIGGSYTANDYVGKLLEARDRLLGDPADGAAIVIATELGEYPEPARAVLQGFVDAMLPSLEQSLKRASESR